MWGYRQAKQNYHNSQSYSKYVPDTGHIFQLENSWTAVTADWKSSQTKLQSANQSPKNSQDSLDFRVSRHSIFSSESSGQVSSIDDDIGALVPVAAGAEHRICLRRAGRATARGHNMSATLQHDSCFLLMFNRFFWLLWKATHSIYTRTNEHILCQPGSVDMR